MKVIGYYHGFESDLEAFKLADPDELVIVNTTPHEVTLLDEAGNVLLSIPPAREPLRAAEKVKELGELAGVKLVEKQLDVEPYSKLPSTVGLRGYPVVYYVVPLAVAQMAGREDFLVPDELVRDAEGRIVGARRFARVRR